MESIQTIKEKLKLLEQETEWLSALRQDTRSGVQKLITSWYRRLAKREQRWSDYVERTAFDRSFGEGIVAGVDEAGRGPLAGPVVTAAVILPEDTTALWEVNDSKQLTKEARKHLAELIRQHALHYAIHIQSREQIDQLNIYEATKQSMVLAIEQLEQTPTIIVSDAMPLPVTQPCHAIIKGDAKSLSIAAASILAKTTRDAYMEELGLKYPQFGFEQHAGYGTPSHLQAIEEHGICEEHRRSFEPIKSLVAK